MRSIFVLIGVVSIGFGCDRSHLLGEGGPDLSGEGGADMCSPQVACPAEVACGAVADGCGGLLDCGPCQLTSLAPSIANTGATVTLEGTFALSATVEFPEGATQE